MNRFGRGLGRRIGVAAQQLDLHEHAVLRSSHAPARRRVAVRAVRQARAAVEREDARRSCTRRAGSANRRSASSPSRAATGRTRCRRGRLRCLPSSMNTCARAATSPAGCPSNAGIAACTLVCGGTRPRAAVAVNRLGPITGVCVVVSAAADVARRNRDHEGRDDEQECRERGEAVKAAGSHREIPIGRRARRLSGTGPIHRRPPARIRSGLAGGFGRSRFGLLLGGPVVGFPVGQAGHLLDQQQLARDLVARDPGPAVLAELLEIRACGRGGAATARTRVRPSARRARRRPARRTRRDATSARLRPLPDRSSRRRS